MRKDRDEYVETVGSGKMFKKKGMDFNARGTPFDLLSIMMYGTRQTTGKEDGERTIIPVEANSIV